MAHNTDLMQLSKDYQELAARLAAIQFSNTSPVYPFHEGQRWPAKCCWLSDANGLFDRTQEYLGFQNPTESNLRLLPWLASIHRVSLTVEQAIERLNKFSNKLLELSPAGKTRISHESRQQDISDKNSASGAQSNWRKGKWVKLLVEAQAKNRHTHKAMASELKTSGSTLTRWRSGKVVPKLESMQLIVDYVQKSGVEIPSTAWGQKAR